MLNRFKLNIITLTINPAYTVYRPEMGKAICKERLTSCKLVFKLLIAFSRLCFVRRHSIISTRDENVSGYEMILVQCISTLLPSAPTLITQWKVPMPENDTASRRSILFHAIPLLVLFKLSIVLLVIPIHKFSTTEIYIVVSLKNYCSKLLSSTCFEWL